MLSSLVIWCQPLKTVSLLLQWMQIAVLNLNRGCQLWIVLDDRDWAFIFLGTVIVQRMVEFDIAFIVESLKMRAIKYTAGI